MLVKEGSGLVLPLEDKLKVKKTSHNTNQHKHTKFPADKFLCRVNARQRKLNDEKIKLAHTYRQSSQLTYSAGKV